MTTPQTNPNSCRIAFLHPDLGIGGAERLIVDAAMALQGYGHTVHVFTSHHDEDHSFDETKTTGQLKIITAGDWLPRAFFGRFAIIFAMLRGIFLSLFLLWNWAEHNPLIRSGHKQFKANHALLGEYDVVITDQLSIYNLFLLFTPSRTIFYCHFPDLLLSKKEENPILNRLKQLYRFPINFLEEITTGMADTILVNSKFTGKTFANTFTTLNKLDSKPKVLYPSIQMSSYDNNFKYDQDVLKWWHWYQSSTRCPKNEPIVVEFKSTDDFAAIESLPRTTSLFVSINRFERKKAVEEAIGGFSQLHTNIVQKKIHYPTPSVDNQYLPYESAKLMIAGGYDPLSVENYEYHLELKAVAENDFQLHTSLYPDMSGDVVFLLSFSQTQRTSLLRRAQAILYTPENEHFGIVPVEAMFSSRTVIAHCSGGPLESVEHGVTGFLCTKWNYIENKPILFHSVVLNDCPIKNDVKNIKKYLEAGKMSFGQAMEIIYAGSNNMELCVNPRAHQHSIDQFSIQVFAKHWNDVVVATKAIAEPKTHWLRQFVNNFGAHPRSRIIILINMTVSILGVMIWTLFRPKISFGRTPNQ